MANEIKINSNIEWVKDLLMKSIMQGSTEATIELAGYLKDLCGKCITDLKSGDKSLLNLSDLISKLNALTTTDLTEIGSIQAIETFLRMIKESTKELQNNLENITEKILSDLMDAISESEDKINKAKKEMIEELKIYLNTRHSECKEDFYIIGHSSIIFQSLLEYYNDFIDNKTSQDRPPVYVICPFFIQGKHDIINKFCKDKPCSRYEKIQNEKELDEHINNGKFKRFLTGACEVTYSGCKTSKLSRSIARKVMEINHYPSGRFISFVVVGATHKVFTNYQSCPNACEIDKSCDNNEFFDFLFPMHYELVHL